MIEHPGIAPYLDSLQDFLFDCLLSIKLIGNGSDFEEITAIKRVTHSPYELETYALRENGGYYVSIEKLR